MDSRYRIEDTTTIYSPALLFYKDLIAENIQRMVRLAGAAERLRPHAKTHKTREITRMELAAGIRKHKCATLAEAEMLAECGVEDILIAYPIVGPNCARLAQLARRYPQVRFAALADHATGIQQLSDVFRSSPKSLEVLLDVDCGQHRTGLAPGDEAIQLYEKLSRLPGLRPGGLHVYDGHNHQAELAERQATAARLLEPVLGLRDALLKKGLVVPRMVFGGTPTFAIYAQLNLPGVELSPGTCVLHDHGYGSKFRDLDFAPAALLLTRVISRPRPNRVTFDLGYKAVASDPPAVSRLVILDLPDAKPVIHNEEHLVVETAEADRFHPGDEAYAMPTHVCPTCALHQFAYVVQDGKVVDRWEIVARDRVLHV